MSPAAVNSWQAVQEEVLRRIRVRAWKPGEMIPNEAELAREFGCARATVNRALRTLAEAGVLDRKRRAGTRVTLQPISKAIIDIPVIRREIEDRNQRYGYAMTFRRIEPAPLSVRARLRAASDMRLLHLIAVHLADARPYVVEDRWINLDAGPKAEQVDFSRISANEWLLANAPYTHGDLSISAEHLRAEEAELLDIDASGAALTITRTTWNGAQAVTTVRLSYPPGYRLNTAL
ncbi:MAG: GntR family transcriptional regulator [Pseudomonadota bacterium]